MIAIYPGSFDPPTVGHLDVIRRAAALFDGVVVAVLHNTLKRAAFSADARVDMLRRCVEGMPTVSVIADMGLLVDVARRAGAGVILRGLRGESDYAMEANVAATHRRLGDLDTLCLFTSPELGFMSSTIVRDVAEHGGNIEGMVPGAILRDIEAHYRGVSRG